MQYEMQTGASRRLLEAVCGSEIVRLRSRLGPFDWHDALHQRKLIAFDGGGIRSKEIKRTIFLLVSMQVIQAVRRHFAHCQEPLPVVLVLEEAGALGLVTPFVLNALQELRKAGLAIHLITQSTVDFGDQNLFEAILANTPWQCWYQSLSPADQELGARALTNATFDSLAIHYTRTRPIPDGVEHVEMVSRGQSFDPRTHTTIRHDRRTGTALRTTYKHVVEASYKTPQLWEQEFRTKLATLPIGERLVRDRGGVRRERVVPVRPPWLRRITDTSTHTLIERLRQQHIYQTCAPPESADALDARPDAAARLRRRIEE